MNGQAHDMPWKLVEEFLKFILNFTGSQGRLLRTGVMCSNVFVITTADAFSTIPGVCTDEVTYPLSYM